MYSVVLASAAIVSMMLIWLGVQTLWRRVFAGEIADEDVLAGRKSCGSCGCGMTCRRDAN